MTKQFVVSGEDALIATYQRAASRNGRLNVSDVTDTPTDTITINLTLEEYDALTTFFSETPFTMWVKQYDIDPLRVGFAVRNAMPVLKRLAALL